MFNIYLKNWVDEIEEEVQDGHNEPVLQTNYYLIDEETLIMSIPFSEGEEPCMINPTIKSEMGKAESLDFTINPGMKYYNSYQELKTLIRVEYKESPESEDAETIFFGRVITINTSNLLAIKSIHAEGAYSVLQDTPIEGLEEELQPKIGQWALFGNIIGEHNDWIGNDNDDSWKQMRIVGLNSIESPISFKDEPDKKCAPTSWNTSMAAIDDLIGNNGGYMKVRYDPTSFPYLKIEWHRKYFRDFGDPVAHPNCERPSFELAKNIIDLSSTDEISELFTRVIPIGHKASTKKNSKKTSFIYVSGKYISVKSIRPSNDWLHDNFQSLDEFVHAEDYYGIIYKTVNFPNADSVGKLEEYATDWIKRNYFGALRSFTVKAIDMKMVNMDRVQNSLILAGDCVDISYPYFDKDGKRHMTTETRLVCKSAQIVLFNPEQNVYTIGVPNDAVDFEYGERKKPKKAGSSTIAGSTSAPPPSNSTVYDLDFDAAYSYLRWFYYANDWGDIATAQSYCAYSWRCGGLTSWTDLAPADSFRANGLPKHEFVEIVDKPIYDPAYPGDPEHIIGYEPTSTEVFDYYYVKIAGLSNVRLMGHYTMSKVPNGLEPGVTSPGYNITNGYTYGFGYVEGTDDAVAFSWNEYTSGKGNPEDSSSAAIEPLFHFPNLFGNHSLGSLSNPDTGANTGITDEEGNPGWVNSDGEVMVEIFPELGTVGAGYAYEYEIDPVTGEPVKNPDGSIKYVIDPETGEPKVLKDENGYPVWAIQLNAPITYVDDQGITHTMPGGALVAQDLKLPGIPSFMTQVAAINTLISANIIANQATISQLKAFSALLGSDAEAYDDEGNFVGYEGTELQTNAEGILGVSGLFQKNDDGTVKLDENGCPKLTGGGVLVKDNDAFLGLWESGAMRAGIRAQKQDGTYYTRISGDKIIIGDNASDVTIADIFKLRSNGSITVNADAFYSGDIYLSSGSGDGRSWDGKLSTKYVTLSGKLLFPDSESPNPLNAATYIDQERCGELVYGGCHIKAIDNNNGTYTLKYLPACLDPSTASDSDWVGDVTFNKAASLTGKWSGSSSAPTFPLTIYAHPQGTTISTGNESYISDRYAIEIGDRKADKKAVLNLTTDTDATKVSGGNGDLNTSVNVPIDIVRVERTNANPSAKDLVVYEKSINVKAWPVWNKAADIISVSSNNATLIVTVPSEITVENAYDATMGKTEDKRFTLSTRTESSSGSPPTVDYFAYISGSNAKLNITNIYDTGGLTAHAKRPVKVTNPTSDQKTAAGSALSAGSIYKIQSLYTKPNGVTEVETDSTNDVYFKTADEPSIQNEKTATVSSNTTIKPDSGYVAMKAVKVTHKHGGTKVTLQRGTYNSQAQTYTWSCTLGTNATGSSATTFDVYYF